MKQCSFRMDEEWKRAEWVGEGRERFMDKWMHKGIDRLETRRDKILKQGHLAIYLFFLFCFGYGPNATMYPAYSSL